MYCLQLKFIYFDICRPLSSGQRGEVYEVSGNRVAVIFDNGGDTSPEGNEKKPTEDSHKLPMHWIDGIFTS